MRWCVNTKGSRGAEPAPGPPAAPLQVRGLKDEHQLFLLTSKIRLRSLAGFLQTSHPLPSFHLIHGLLTMASGGYSSPGRNIRKKRSSEMMFMTITFTFPSLDVVFLPAQLWWHSLGSCWCRLPGQEPQQRGRCLTPSPFLTPPSQPPPPGETQPLLPYLSLQQFVPSTRQLYLPAAVFVQALRGLDKPAFKHAAAAGGEGRELLGDCKEAPRRTSALSFLPPLLSCTTLAPLSIRLARKTRRVGAALPGLP